MSIDREMMGIDREILFAALRAQLEALSAQLHAGFDVAPAQRLRAEGYAAALLSAGINADELMRFCTNAIANSAALTVSRRGDTLQFDCRQQRAPVYPSAPE